MFPKEGQRSSIGGDRKGICPHLQLTGPGGWGFWGQMWAVAMLVLTCTPLLQALSHPLQRTLSVSGSRGRGFLLRAESRPCHPHGQEAMTGLSQNLSLSPSLLLSRPGRLFLGLARGHKPLSSLESSTEKQADMGAAGHWEQSLGGLGGHTALHPHSHQEPARSSGSQKLIPSGWQARVVHSVSLPPPDTLPDTHPHPGSPSLHFL